MLNIFTEAVKADIFRKGAEITRRGTAELEDTADPCVRTDGDSESGHGASSVRQRGDLLGDADHFHGRGEFRQ